MKCERMEAHATPGPIKPEGPASHAYSRRPRLPASAPSRFPPLNAASDFPLLKLRKPRTLTRARALQQLPSAAVAALAMAPPPKNSDSAAALQAAIDGNLSLLKGNRPPSLSLSLSLCLSLSLSRTAASPGRLVSTAAPSFGAALVSFDLSTSLGRDARFETNRPARVCPAFNRTDYQSCFSIVTVVFRLKMILIVAISISLVRAGGQGEPAGCRGRQGAERAPLRRGEGTPGGLQVPSGGIGAGCQLRLWGRYVRLAGNGILPL
jgi:hypothetical protein